MALGVRGFVRIGATIAGCALVAACTPEQPPAVTPTPTPAQTAMPSPTPSVTPTETDIERRMRLDWEAAEEAYRLSIAEVNRLAEQGETRASTALKEVSTGAYLDVQLSSLRGIKARGWRLEGKITIVGVSRIGGWNAKTLNLVACEDNSTWRVFDRSNRDVTPRDKPDYIQELTVNKIEEKWKVTRVVSRKVANVSAKDCPSR